MASLFFDSSAIVKRYVNEIGSNFVENLTDVQSGNIVLLARITHVEVAAAIARRLKNSNITATDAQQALAAFRHDLTNNYFTVEITPALLSNAVDLATNKVLRGYDAVQLAAALEANNETASAGLPPVIMVSADTDLNTAAIAEGFIVENPNNHH